MMIKKRVQGCLLVAALVASGGAAAIGIGEARVDSFLGEPLRVRIALNLAPGEGLDDNCVAIASPPGQTSAFFPDLVRARFELVERGGRAELSVTTRRPWSDPILVLPLKVGCGGGALYREITLLVDPPTLAAPREAARATRPAPRAEAPRTVQRAAPSQRRTAPRHAAPRPAPAPPEDGRWRVQPGQTLSGIVVSTGLGKGDRRRRNALIDAIVEANPEVFRGRGPDYLPAGALIAIPGWGGSAPLTGGEEPAPADRTPRAPETESAAKSESATESDFRLQLAAPREPTPVTTPELREIEEEMRAVNAAAERERREYELLQDRLLQLRQQAADLQVATERLARQTEELQTLDTAARDARDAPGDPAARAPGAIAVPAVPEPLPPTVAGVQPPQSLPVPAPVTAPVSAPALATAPEPKPTEPPREVDDGSLELLVLALLIVAVLIVGGLLVRRNRALEEEEADLQTLMAAKEAPAEPVEEAPDPWATLVADTTAQTTATPATVAPAPAPTADEAAVTAPAPAELGDLDIDLEPAEADFRHQLFDVEEVDSLLEQAEVLLLFGEPGKAAEMLSDYLEYVPPGTAEPRPWLKLLEVLRADGQEVVFAGWAARFARAFNIACPIWDETEPVGPGVPGLSLDEACPHIVERLTSIWSQPFEAVEYLDALMLDDRDGERHGFTREIADDLLVLRDIARGYAM